MEFPELEASGMAQVRSIEPCPPIADGSGNVVTARIVTRQVSELVEIGFSDDEVLTGTPQHPIWSIERQDWIELGDLEIGEHLWTEEGPVEVQSKRLLTTAESVYNLEVHGHHIYQVGELGVLVHNTAGNQCRKIAKSSSDASRRLGSGRNKSTVSSSRKRAKDSRPKHRPHKAKLKRKAEDAARMTRHQRNKLGEGSKMKTDGGAQTPHFHVPKHSLNGINIHLRTGRGRVKPG